MPRSSRKIWFFIAPNTGILSTAGPWEVFGHTNEILGRKAYELEAYSPTAPTNVLRHGLQLTGLRPIPKRVSRLPNTVIVTGGSSAQPLDDRHHPIIDFLRQHAGRIRRTVSICVGAFLLAEAGLLDARRATTHWQYVAELARRYPNAHVVDDGIFVEDRGVWTSAGLAAGIDLALALVEADHGHEAAMAVAKRMVLFLRRSGNQSQFSGALNRQTRSKGPDRDLVNFVLAHLDEALSVERVAAELAMSPRTLTRFCREHFLEAPAELVRRIRLDEARRLLAETDLPIKAIGAQTGLGDPSTMWRQFTTELGVTPAEYRQRFAPRG